jgi:hypothetical protein
LLPKYIFRPSKAFIHWLGKWHWIFVCLTLGGIVGYKILERKPVVSFLRQNILELSIIIVLMMMVGVLLELLVMSLNQQRQVLEVIDTKQRVSRELAQCADRESLLEYVVRLPASVADVPAAVLFLLHPVNQVLEEDRVWGSSPAADPLACAECLENHPDPRQLFSECKHSWEGRPPQGAARRYNLWLVHGSEVVGVLQMVTQPGRTLTADQASIFKNISADIAVVLRYIQEPGVSIVELRGEPVGENLLPAAQLVNERVG